MTDWPDSSRLAVRATEMVALSFVYRLISRYKGRKLASHSFLDLILFKFLKLIYPNIALRKVSDDF